MSAATSIAAPAEPEPIAANDNAAAPSTACDAVLTVVDAAALLKLGRNAVYESVARGEIPHRRIGNRLRFSKTALIRWLGGNMRHGNHWACDRRPVDPTCAPCGLVGARERQ